MWIKDNSVDDLRRVRNEAVAMVVAVTVMCGTGPSLRRLPQLVSPDTVV